MQGSPLTLPNKEKGAGLFRVNPHAYDELADEYYDQSRHPTCANFRRASELLISPYASSIASQPGIFCEVGAGCALLPEVLGIDDSALARVVLADSSLAMLRHSLSWVSKGTLMTVADARRLPLSNGTVGIIVSSLGDPYNDEEFWEEVARLLMPSGLVFFTTPAYAWMTSFRPFQEKYEAEFVTSEGKIVRVPSNILSESEQQAMIQRIGLEIIKIDHARVTSLGNNSLSPKIPRVSTLPIVTLFCARKCG